MSTNGAIARPRGDGWEGRYHHWDSGPTGLGRAVWDLVQARGVPWTQDTLIDAHVEWSTIVGVDWSLEPMAPGPSARSAAPACYCHGPFRDRVAGPAVMIRSEDATGGEPVDWIEWVYVIGRLALTVYAATAVTWTGREFRWEPVGTFPWSGPEPDWEALEARPRD